MQNATSPANHFALPESWVARIFDHMAALYGSKFADLWRGTDASAVRRKWAEKLGGFHDKPEAIKSALDALDERPFPPTLPEFIGLCRDAARRIGPTTAALPHRLTPEEQDCAEKAAAMAKDALRKAGERDHLAWAKKPRSRIAFDALADLARNGDSRFREIMADLIAQGATDGYKLIKAWDG